MKGKIYIDILFLGDAYEKIIKSMCRSNIRLIYSWLFNAWKRRKAETGDWTVETISNLMSSYISIDGQYTKLTTLEYDDNSSNYHAGANGRSRRTYYDENVNALLMGDYDGGFQHINSGYAKEGTDVNNMVHYRNNAEAITSSNLFSARNVDYTVYNTNPIAYFDVLSDLVDIVSKSSKSNWALQDGKYIYQNGDLVLRNTDPYNDGLLKEFQYFAAPMLLVNETVGLAKVEISVDSTSFIQEALKIVLRSSDNSVISTAYVFEGLHLGSLLA